MTFGIGFILLLLALGGFAAYQGDRVGMSVGRKRLTIFGLRPKYTSRIVTVLTGIIIVSLTMSSLLLISHSARQSLFGLEALQATVSDLSLQVTQLESRQQALTETNAALQVQNSALRSESESLEERRKALEAANALLRDEQQILLGRVADISGAAGVIYDNILQTAEQIFDNLLKSRLVYQANQVITSYVVDVPATRGELVQSVQSLLNRTNALALAAGAGEYSTPGWALILERKLIDETGSETLVSQEQHIEELVQSIWTTPGLMSVVVQVLSKRHTFEGSPVELDFNLFVNARVFHAGETVTSRIFDGRQSGPDLLNQVWSWLEGDVPQAARDRGLLASPDGKVTAGLEPGTLFSVVERIQAVGGPVRVRAVAATNVNTSDELPLRFEYDPQ